MSNCIYHRTGALCRQVGEGFVCLWCNERGRHFTSVDAVQKHMRDKGHTKMLHEGEVSSRLLESSAPLSSRSLIFRQVT